MNQYEREMNAKRQAVAECGQIAAGVGVSLGGTVAKDTPYRPGIRERIDQAMRAANSANERAFLANDIRSILDQNPDFARLLDLLDQFNRF